MSAAPTRTPPRVARSLLRGLLPGEVRDDVDGDLHELYSKRRTDSGAAVAAAWYWVVTLSFVMRFTFDRFARALRGLARGDAAPSALDIKLGARILAKSPGLSLVGGLGIAVAVALAAAGYAVVNSYFYPDVPLNQGDRLVALAKFDRQTRLEEDRLLFDFLVWRRELRTVTDIGAFRTIRRNLVSESGQGEPITLAEMTSSGFRAARVPPLRGRFLIDADERPGAPAVVVIGYDVWQRRFGRDPSIVGRELRIGRETHTIVGVMPAGFAFPISHQYWVPLRIDPRAVVAPETGPRLNVFGRLAAGATKESAEAELRVVTRQSSPLSGARPELAALQPRVLPYTEVFMHGEQGGSNETMATLRFVVALFLVVVAMNVGVLVYARTVMRTGEIAVRTALGATRARIVAQLFAEAFVLSGLSSLIGLGVVAVGLRMFDAALVDMLDGEVPFWMHAGVSFGTVVYTVALAVLAALIVGVVPALRATGAKLRGAMGSIGSGAKAQLGATWTVLIVAQVAVTVAVLPPALLKGWEMIQEATRPPYFTAGTYLSTRFVVESDAKSGALASDSAAADTARAITQRLMARLAIEPGVAAASVTTGAPWEGIGATLEADGKAADAKRAVVLNVDTSFFGLFGARMLAGRPFTASDVPLRYIDRPVIVSRSFVTELLGGGDAVGRRVRYQSLSKDPQPWLTIVGVVEDFPPAIRNASESTKRGARMYQLAMPGESREALLTIRLNGRTPETFMPSLRRIATSVDPMLQLSHMSTFDAMYRDYAKGGAQLALVVALVTAVVILLSGAGIHALMSFAVNQRRREIGIRAALGAPASRILRSVLARATRQLALGLGIGLVVTVAINRASGGAMMSGTAFVLVPMTVALMLVVGLVAATGPVRRGLSVQPTEALRGE